MAKKKNLTVVTIKEFKKLMSYTLKDIATEINCSISLLSKISNGVEVLTDDTIFKFEYAFPGYTLTGGKENWKEKYIQTYDELCELNKKYLAVIEENGKLRVRLNKIGKMVEGN